MPANNSSLDLPNPYLTFRFLVEVDGITQAVFTECRLPDIEWEPEAIKEGGLNTYVHQLPGRRKPAKVTLKNGLAKDSLLDWYADLMEEEFDGFRKNVSITLLDSTHETVMVWNIRDAYPVKWTGPELKTGDNAVAIQSLELACGEVSIDRDAG
jgi:phage tail-like protein